MSVDTKDMKESRHGNKQKEGEPQMVGKKTKVSASSNWLALQKTLPPGPKDPPRKRRKLDSEVVSTLHSDSYVELVSKGSSPRFEKTDADTTVKNGESLASLRNMIAGQTVYTPTQQLPGKYLALDCEMVGIGLDGTESSLARVSLVNFYGAVIMDEFVKQRERVVDYRTQWSGVRPNDMEKAKPFTEIQKKVADLLQDRILVGHAVYNDLKALLLSHPRQLIRDTQHLAYKFGVTKSRRPALRNLVKDELGVLIQDGEHSSVTDSRATMSLYRLYKREWESGISRTHTARQASVISDAGSVDTKGSSKKRTLSQVEGEEGDDKDNEDATDGPHSDAQEDEDNPDRPSGNSKSSHSSATTTSSKLNSRSNVKSNSNSKSTPKIFPGGGRKGVSSGLSTIVKTPNSKRRRSTAPSPSPGPRAKNGVAIKEVGAAIKEGAKKNSWWKALPAKGGQK